MKRVFVSALTPIILVACTNEDTNSNMLTQKEMLVEKQRKIQQLEKELNTIESEHLEFLGNLQVVDRTSRNILRLIASRSFKQLSEQYTEEFELESDEVLFNYLEGNLPFPIDLAKHPAHIASYSKSDVGTDLAYFIPNPKIDKYELIVFHFDNDLNFKYILVGAE